MTTSTDPVSPDHGAILVQSPGQADSAVVAVTQGNVDLYAESELQMRHERTERMIRLAEEQAT